MYEVKILKNVVYTKTEREFLTADIYLPVGKEEIPCIIMMHGGGWKFGTAEAYTEWGLELARRGICGMSINYRVATLTYPAWPGCLDDVEAACNFLVSKAYEWNLDPYNMGFMGDSSGAHLGFMQAFRHEYTSHKIRLIVGAYGVYDVLKWGQWAERRWPNASNIVTNLVGVDLHNHEAYKAVSPYYQIDRVRKDYPMFDPDILLCWGEQDSFVPCVEQSVPFAQKCIENKLRVKTIAVPDAAHVWFPRDIIAGDINPLDKYPLSYVAPQVLDFIEEVFSRPRFKINNYEGGYDRSPAFRITRFKEGGIRPL